MNENKNLNAKEQVVKLFLSFKINFFVLFILNVFVF